LADSGIGPKNPLPERVLKRGDKRVNRIGFEPMACRLEVFRRILAILETQASRRFND